MTSMNQFQMDPRHKNLLRDHRVLLVKNLLINEHFMAIMSTHRIFTENMCEELEVKKTKSAKAAYFLDLLVRRGPRAFGVLIEALVATEQTDLALALDPILAKQCEMSEGKLMLAPPAQIPIQETQQAAAAEKLSQAMEDDEPPLLAPYIDKMIRVTAKQAEHFMTDKKVYPMRSYPRGRALIINIGIFEDHRLQKRTGADFDTANLFQLFQALYYDTTFKENITAEAILQLLEAERQHPAHKDADSFILCILSHGAQGKIYGSDGKAIEVSTIMEYFNGTYCKALLHKPKAFFIQACQGDTETFGVVESDCIGDTVTKSDAHPLNDEVTKTLENLKLYDDPNSAPDPKKTHEMADTVVAYATVPGFKSYRQTTHGSWFVRTLIKEMCRSAHNEHLIDMLTVVRKEVIKLRTNEMIFGKPHHLQLTETRETLLQKWYLLPGYPPHSSKLGL